MKMWHRVLRLKQGARRDRWFLRRTVQPILLVLAGHYWLGMCACNSFGQHSASPVKFDRDIRPLLAAHCFQCHGPGQAEAGLRLDNARQAMADLESGLRAVVPGQAEESELLRRLTADESERMPPEGEPLAANKIRLLRQWIETGAEWPEHWAYRPLVKPSVPEFQVSSSQRQLVHAAPRDWPRNDIDHFVLRQMREHGMSPAPEAHRRALLRRLYFNFWGLPPTPEQLEAFLNDSADDAYERVVDRLLDSPRYAERWARHWMDVVHYADSHGFEHDTSRDAWPYRDYLIRAFSEDRPYAQFIEEQVAGDVLYPEDPDALVATGFLATGPWDLSAQQAGNPDSIDYKIAQYLDRDDIVSTVISTFVSTTVHCARCHDHKFDPVTQSDYYSLQAVFAGIDKAHRLYDADSEVARRRKELLARRARLAAQQRHQHPSLLGLELQAEIGRWEATEKQSSVIWTQPKLVEVRSESGVTLTPQLDGSVLSSGGSPETDTYTFVIDISLARVTALRLELLTDGSLPHSGPGRQANGNLHLSEFVVSAAPVAEPMDPQPLSVKRAAADFGQDGWSIEMAIDDKPETAWGIYPEVGIPHEGIFELKEPCEHEDGIRLTVELQQNHGSGHLIGKLRLSVSDASSRELGKAVPLPLEIARVLETPADQRNAAQKCTLAAYYIDQQIAAELASLPAQTQVYCGTNQFEPNGGLRPAAEPRTIHVLHRGEITQPREEAHPGTLSCLPGLPNRFDIHEPVEGARRAALAHWLSDADNVLTWRSIANRVWHYHFGVGLVDTPSDFGRMGSAPTHPELLDWLAVTLQESGGSLKWLHRLIVTSATYRQSSCHHEDYAARDAANRRLWRMNRRRLDAESIRDTLLYVSGALNLHMGGPPVRQFVETQTFNLRAEVDYDAFNLDSPGAMRRSIYRYLMRTMPDPLMDALDCPNGSTLTPRRTESLTPLQALAVMNNVFIIRQSERLARRLNKETEDEHTQIERVWLLLFSRSPEPHEREMLLKYSRRHGLTNACRMLFNTNEFLFID